MRNRLTAVPALILTFLTLLSSGIVVVVLLLALPSLIFAQDGDNQTSPLVVDGCRTSKTTVTTYEPFKLTCRIRFMDLSEYGRNIKILTDELDPKNVSLAPFEAEGEVRIKKEKTDGVFVWDITYTLRRIGKEKGVDTIPPLAIQWVLIDESGSEEYKTSYSKPLVINYVSSITPEENIDIRDSVDLGSFKEGVYLFWALTLFFLLAAFVIFWQGVRKRPAVAETVEEVQRILEDRYRKLSVAESIKFARKMIRSLKKEDDLIKVKRDLIGIIRRVILACVPALSWGSTPKEMYGYIDEKLVRKRLREVLLELARYMINYQEDLDRKDLFYLTSSEEAKAHLNDIKYLKYLLKEIKRASLVDRWRSFTVPFKKISRLAAKLRVSL